MNIQKVLKRMHKYVPTDKICTYCFMKKQYMKRHTKMMKILFNFFGGQSHGDFVSILKLEKKICSMNKDKNAHLNSSNNRDEKMSLPFKKNEGLKKAIWGIGLTCDHELSKNMPPNPKETLIVSLHVKKSYCFYNLVNNINYTILVVN